MKTCNKFKTKNKNIEACNKFKITNKNSENIIAGSVRARKSSLRSESKFSTTSQRNPYNDIIYIGI